MRGTIPSRWRRARPSAGARGSDRGRSPIRPRLARALLHRRQRLPDRAARRRRPAHARGRRADGRRSRARHGVSITARGGGTSQAGQAIGAGLQLDTSKYFNRVLEVNVAERWAWVEPGVVLDELNAHAAAARPAVRARHLHRQPRHRRRHDRQQLERRAVGAVRQDDRSRARARTSCWPTASLTHFRPLDAAALEHGVRRRARSRRSCYRAVRQLAATAATRSIGAFRRCCGASAATTSTSSSIRPSRSTSPSSIVGSEGTLGAGRRGEASIWCRCRRAKAVLTIEFDELLDALGATPLILRHRPSAVEVMDQFILDHAQREPGARRAAAQHPAERCRARCCASSSTATAPRICRRGSTRSKRELAAARLSLPLAARGLPPPIRRASGASARRRSGLSMAMKGDAKSLSFVEDTAVAPEKLRDYIERFLQIVRGTARSPASTRTRRSAACTSGPVVNMKTAEGVQAVRGDRQRHRRSRARVRRRAVGRARRRPGARSVHREDVRPGALRRVPDRQAHVRSRTASSTPARSSTRRR